MNPATRALVEKAVEYFCTALTNDCEAKYTAALTSYIEGLSLLLRASKDAGVSIPVQEVLNAKCKEYLARIQVIKDHTAKGEPIPPNKYAEKAESGLPDFDEETNEILTSFSEVPTKLRSLEDFYGDPECKNFLEKNVMVPLMFPGQLDRVTRVKRGILLYGLPGTGKTALIGTILASVSCPFLRVPSSNLCSRFHGAEKMVKHTQDIFEWAKRNQPCILCFEDLEILCQPDDDITNSIAKQVCEEITSGLQGYSPDNQVTIIGSTGKPWHLNGKLVRKFDRRFQLALPNLDDRVAIFKQNLSDVKHELSDEDFRTIGKMTENFTGADLVVLAHDCMMEPVRHIQCATHFRKIVIMENQDGEEASKEMLTPCSATDSGALEITWDFLNAERIVEPVITMSFAEKCLEKCAPSCSEEEMLVMAKWASEFGQD